MADPKVLFKEERDPRQGAFVAVRRVLVLSGNHNRVLIRLFHRGDCVVTAVRLAVYRIGENEEIQACREFSFFDLSAEPNAEFAVPDILLDPVWSKVRVEVLAVRSSDREYDFRLGSVDQLETPASPKGKMYERNPFKKIAAVLTILIVLFAALSFLICFQAGWFKANEAVTNFEKYSGTVLCGESESYVEI